ncbi:hypothetical protein HPB50_021143 [Hyalomma asiaticum]|uniref:Uncharacterized protein n=1 Tax=Hyalomma asiaticum TaxID=266040 RepID=A0ACB7TQX4_HYAAI|nr:hypothetical protein HPB50_021143 [Hyalomma asiaticum]
MPLDGASPAGRRHGNAVKTIDRRGHVEPRSEPEPSSGRRSLDRRRDAGSAAEPNPIGLRVGAGRTSPPARDTQSNKRARDTGRTVTNPLRASLAATRLGNGPLFPLGPFLLRPTRAENKGSQSIPAREKRASLVISAPVLVTRSQKGIVRPVRRCLRPAVNHPAGSGPSNATHSSEEQRREQSAGCAPGLRVRASHPCRCCWLSGAFSDEASRGLRTHARTGRTSCLSLLTMPPERPGWSWVLVLAWSAA